MASAERMEVVEGGKGGRGTRRRFRKGGQGISLGEGQFCADFKEVREQLIEFYLGRAFPAEATARAKALRQDGDWLVLRNSEEAGRTNSRASQRGWSVQGLFDPQGAWLLS